MVWIVGRLADAVKETAATAVIARYLSVFKGSSFVGMIA
jgi:hypothetical protein